MPGQHLHQGGKTDLQLSRSPAGEQLAVCLTDPKTGRQPPVGKNSEVFPQGHIGSFRVSISRGVGAGLANSITWAMERGQQEASIFIRQDFVQ